MRWGKTKAWPFRDALFHFLLLWNFRNETPDWLLLVTSTHFSSTKQKTFPLACGSYACGLINRIQFSARPTSDTADLFDGNLNNNKTREKILWKKEKSRFQIKQKMCENGARNDGEYRNWIRNALCLVVICCARCEHTILCEWRKTFSPISFGRRIAINTFKFMHAVEYICNKLKSLLYIEQTCQKIFSVCLAATRFSSLAGFWAKYMAIVAIGRATREKWEGER